MVKKKRRVFTVMALLNLRSGSIIDRPDRRLGPSRPS